MHLIRVLIMLRFNCCVWSVAPHSLAPFLPWPRTTFYFTISSSGVPGMVARLLGATVVLTEQDELLSLLDRNLANNFPQDKGIRQMALDWERCADTDAILASLVASKVCSSSRVGADAVRGSAAVEAPKESFAHRGEAIEERDGAGGRARLDLSADGGAQPGAVEGCNNSDAGGEDGEEGAVVGRPTHLEFILCAE